MNVSQIVNLIVKKNPDWTPQSVLDLLDGFVQMALKVDTRENLYYDPTTGDLPYLQTTAGQFYYELDQQYYKVREIVCSTKQINFNNPAFNSNSGRFNYNVKAITIGNNKYYPVPVVKKQQYNDIISNPAGTCSVMFRFDPKDTTETYQIYAYVPTNAITSLNSTLNIPDKFHMGVVIPALQLMIDGMDNGRWVDNLEVINNNLLPKIWYEMYTNSADNEDCQPMGL